MRTARNSRNPDRRFSISQIEEIGFDLFWQRKDELARALWKVSPTDNQTRVFRAARSRTSPATEVMLLMSRESPHGWEEINYPQLEDKLYQLDEVVSRKKQLLPLIISLLESAPITST